MADRPNIVFLLADQLRASSLPAYGERQIETPHTHRLAREGVTFTNMISTCPVSTPYRSMLLTGRHPQTTGHVINFMRTRHDEIGLGDAFARAGYRTAWIGKWHLHTGSFPQIGGPDYVPEGRDRLGFEHWRGYNFHTDYFDGWVNLDGWRCERWKGYETRALNRYAFEFMDAAGSSDDGPFCLFVSPHQPHFTPHEWAPESCFERLPARLELPANVPEAKAPRSLADYRNYLAMTLALDDMLGELLDYLDRAGLAENTLVVYTSDHGTQMGAHGWAPFQKKVPYEESLLVPMFARWPGVFEGGGTCDELTAPVDMFPTLCALAGVAVPRTVEGRDLAAAWRGEEGASGQDAVLTMNFTAAHDYLEDGEEWRGVRTRTHSYARWLSGLVELHDLREDPLQMRNLAASPECAPLASRMESTMRGLMHRLGDELVPCSSYASWFDEQRRVVRNVRGALPDPEGEPDWSMLG